MALKADGSQIKVNNADYTIANSKKSNYYIYVKSAVFDSKRLKLSAQSVAIALQFPHVE